jgi:hypothetical protein
VSLHRTFSSGASNTRHVRVQHGLHPRVTGGFRLLKRPMLGAEAVGVRAVQQRQQRHDDQDSRQDCRSEAPVL